MQVPIIPVKVGDLFFKYEYIDGAYVLCEYECSKKSNDETFATLTNLKTGKYYVIWKKSMDRFHKTELDAAIAFVNERMEWIDKHVADIKKDAAAAMWALEQGRKKSKVRRRKCPITEK